MNLDIENWKEFKIGKILKLYNGKGITKEEIEGHEGNLNVVQSGEDNNGVLGKIDIKYCDEMNYVYTTKPCLTVARSGSAGFVSFQMNGCVVGDSAKILLLEDGVASINRYLFVQTLLCANRFKYQYGRKVTEKNYLADTIILPVKRDTNGDAVIDHSKKYSAEGYVPDWDWMEQFVASLNNKKLTTSYDKDKISNLDVNKWEEFFLHKIFDTRMGNGIDAQNTSTDAPKYNYVSRDSNGNGVVAFVDEVEDAEVFPKGTMTLALGGSFLGSCFVQDEPFYTAQNVGILIEREPLSIHTKQFLATIIRNECKIKYQAFGRELNAHFRKDFTLKLPIKRDDNGAPIIDSTKKYSKQGYIPDWQWMENYIKNLAYGDKL